MQAIEALLDLQKKFADRLAYSWPDEEVGKKCEASIRQIKNIFSSDIEDIDFSNVAQSEFLSNLLYRYLTFDDNKFTSPLIEQLSAWLFHCYLYSNTEIKTRYINELEDSFVLGKIFKLFHNKGVNKHIICNNLLYSYLGTYKNCSARFIKSLQSYLQQTGIIENVKMYFNQENFLLLFSKEVMEKEDFEIFLISAGIKPKFTKTSYFSDLWFDWVMQCANVFSKKFLSEQLKTRIHSVKIDEQKVILSYIASTIDKTQKTEEKGLYFKEFLLPFIDKRNPLHEEFWKVNEELYKKYKIFLDNAPKIFRNYYVSEFISIFFDAFENTGGDRSRSVFWKKYKNRINDFALGLKDNDIRTMRNYIKEHIPDNAINGYLEVLSEYTLRLRYPKSNTPAVLVLCFDSIIIIEFSITGNAAYIYQNNEKSHNNYLKTDNKYNEDDFKNKASPSFEDTFYHRGSWQYTFGNRLRRDYNIEP